MTDPETEPDTDPGPAEVRDVDPAVDAHAFDPAILIEVAGSYLLGGDGPRLTRHEVAERAGVPLAQAQELWRALGFAETGNDQAAFTSADVEALQRVQELIGLHFLDASMLPALVRTMGSTLSRMADWQTRLLLSTLARAEDDDVPLELLTEIVPLVEQLQSYVWRRHLVSAASRLMWSGRNPLQ